MILVIYGYKQSPKLLSYKHKNALFNKNICYVRLIKTVLSRGKKFSSYSHSLRHSYMHTIEKPNVCKDCGKGFLCIDSLISTLVSILEETL